MAMLLFSLLVAGSNSFGKLIANDIDPAALTAIRFAGIVALTWQSLAWADWFCPSQAAFWDKPSMKRTSPATPVSMPTRGGLIAARGL